MPQNPPTDKPAAPDKPVVHFTKQGERYVDAGELLRSNAAKKAIESMIQIDSKVVIPNMTGRTDQNVP